MNYFLYRDKLLENMLYNVDIGRDIMAELQNKNTNITNKCESLDV